MEGDILGTGARVSVGTGVSPAQCPACQCLLSPTASPGPLMYPYQSLHRISCLSLTQCLALSPILLAQLLPGPMHDRPVGPSALRSLCWLCCLAPSSSLTAFPLPGVLHLVSEHCPSFLLECLSLGFCLPQHPASSHIPHPLLAHWGYMLCCLLHTDLLRVSPTVALCTILSQGPQPTVC